jgi:hypothetical protein
MSPVVVSTARTTLRNKSQRLTIRHLGPVGPAD